MQLQALLLKNFRGYRDFRIDFTDNLNILIGKNDIGKSTILEALEIFFNSDKIKLEKEDLCIYHDDPIITIGVMLKLEENKKYIIDTIPVSLIDEYLLNKEGFLEIHKTWDCTKARLEAKQSLIAYYPSEFIDSPLIAKKITDVKKEYEKIFNDNEGEARKNTLSEMRQELYAKISSGKREEVEIIIEKEVKNIWENIQQDLPIYCLFQADRTNKDTDKDVQDPLKAITKRAIEEVNTELNAVLKKIELNAKEIGEQTIAKLSEMNPELADILTPEISHKAWDSLFSFSFIGNDNIPINKRGSGVRRLILLNYFEQRQRRKTQAEILLYMELKSPRHLSTLIINLCWLML